jgi:hypothetical protein
MTSSAREEYLMPGLTGLDTAITLSEEYPQLFAGRKFMERENIKRVLQLFNEKGIRYCLVGGLALAHHSIPRVTQDVDVMVLPEDLPAIQGLLKGHERRGTAVVQISEIGKTRFDIIPANLRSKRQAVLEAVNEDFEGESIKVASLRNLIFLKLWASSERHERLKRAQDETDVIGLIELNPEAVSAADIAYVCSTLLALAYTPEDVRKYQAKIDWLNGILDELELSDLKYMPSK